MYESGSNPGYSRRNLLRDSRNWLVTVFECDECGAVVTDPTKHTDWHKRARSA